MSEILINSLRIKHFPKVHIEIKGVGPSGQVDSTGRDADHVGSVGPTSRR